MACSQRDHSALKRSLTEFRAGTVPAGVQRLDGQPVIELGTCAAPGCGSTLGYELSPDLAETVETPVVSMHELVHGGPMYGGDEEETWPGGSFLVNVSDENERNGK